MSIALSWYISVSELTTWPSFKDMEPLLVILLSSGVLLALFVRQYLAGRHLRKIRGPESPSWLMGTFTLWSPVHLLNISAFRLSGHNSVLNGQLEVGALEREWMKEYGLIWRLKDCFNVSPVCPGHMSHSNK